MYTITEIFIPVSVAYGESINLFYSSVCKDVSFYECILLLVFVSSVLLAILFFSVGFVVLLIFNYELNFFHIISLRKSSNQSSSFIYNQKTIPFATHFVHMKKENNKDKELISNNSILNTSSLQDDQLAESELSDSDEEDEIWSTPQAIPLEY